MKNLCILCEDSKIDEVRKTAKSFTDEDTLKIPLSPDGNLPATHWFCYMVVNDDKYTLLMQLKNYSIMEESTPAVFFKKYNLRPILK